MLLNRMAGFMPREEPQAPAYYVVSGPFGMVMVPPAEARALMRKLRRWIRPRWVRVRDLSGSEVWLPSSLIAVVGESTAAQRAHDRELRRALEQEDNRSMDEWS